MSGILSSLGTTLFGGAPGGRPRSENLIYAVGDIHGRSDLLEPLMESILNDSMVEREGSDQDFPPSVVFMGDMVDRGPDTRGTLEFLSAVHDWPEIDPVFLMGNHEVMLLEFLADPVKHRRWLHYGGYETLVSYGLGQIGDIAGAEELGRISEALREAMGPHVAFIEACVSWHINGNLVFVHAGADPELPLASQRPETLIWGAENFERKRRRDGLWVVYGHTIVERPAARRGRIPIDTGAYVTGVLTALKANGEKIGFLRQTVEQ